MPAAGANALQRYRGLCKHPVDHAEAEIVSGSPFHRRSAWGRGTAQTRSSALPGALNGSAEAQQGDPPAPAASTRRARPFAGRQAVRGAWVFVSRLIRVRSWARSSGERDVLPVKFLLIGSTAVSLGPPGRTRTAPRTAPMLASLVEVGHLPSPLARNGSSFPQLARRFPRKRR